MLLKTSNETALCNGMMMVVDDLVTSDGGGDEGVMCLCGGYFLFRMTVGIT